MTPQALFEINHYTFEEAENTGREIEWFDDYTEFLENWIKEANRYIYKIDLCPNCREAKPKDVNQLSLFGVKE